MALDQKSPGLEGILELAEEALQLIPGDLRQHLTDVLLRVEDFPDPDVMTELGLESPFELLGLYQGISLAEKSVMDVVGGPDMIFLYRRPILDFWRAGQESLAAIVRHVLIHEAGHHFGFSDADMEQLERDADQVAQDARNSSST